MKVHGIPITGSKTAMKPKAPVLTTPNTSASAQRLVKQPPYPFNNAKGIANLPISERKESYDSDYSGPNKALQGTKIGAKALPNMKDAGQMRPINHKGNVFGRFGTKHPKKVGGADLLSKYPQKKHAGFFGDKH